MVVIKFYGEKKMKKIAYSIIGIKGFRNVREFRNANKSTFSGLWDALWMC